MPRRKHRLSSTFGQDWVTHEQREKLVRGVFNRVADRYDLMKDLMSMGVHRFCKWLFCREINSASKANASEQLFVDLAGGTGDIARSLIAEHRKVLLLDPSEKMMRVAEKRLGDTCQYIKAAAEDIPLSDNSVDILTISFGIRNTTDIKQSFQEITRALKPGGHLTASNSAHPLPGYDRFMMPGHTSLFARLGTAVAGHPDAYTYLIESIREFPAQQEMAEMIRASGQDNVSYSNPTFGIAWIHRGEKPQP